MARTLEFAPRLMPSPQAAHYLGVSETMLRNLPVPRKELGTKRLYDRTDLDAYAGGLPYADGGKSLAPQQPVTNKPRPKKWG